MAVAALWGVYHANGGLAGELAYIVGKLRGTAHCALCDITHGALRKKAAFEALECRTPVPLRLVHLNEQPEGLDDLTRGCTPCLVAEVAGDAAPRWRMVLTAEELEACQGSVEAFEAAVQARLAALEGDG